jgi:hypothetical protein
MDWSFTGRYFAHTPPKVALSFSESKSVGLMTTGRVKKASNYHVSLCQKAFRPSKFRGQLGKSVCEIGADHHRAPTWTQNEQNDSVVSLVEQAMTHTVGHVSPTFPRVAPRNLERDRMPPEALAATFGLHDKCFRPFTEL